MKLIKKIIYLLLVICCLGIFACAENDDDPNELLYVENDTKYTLNHKNTDDYTRSGTFVVDDVKNTGGIIQIKMYEQTEKMQGDMAYIWNINENDDKKSFCYMGISYNGSTKKLCCRISKFENIKNLHKINFNAKTNAPDDDPKETILFGDTKDNVGKLKDIEDTDDVFSLTDDKAVNVILDVKGQMNATSFDVTIYNATDYDIPKLSPKSEAKPIFTQQIEVSSPISQNIFAFSANVYAQQKIKGNWIILKNYNEQKDD